MLIPNQPFTRRLFSQCSRTSRNPMSIPLDLQCYILSGNAEVYQNRTRVHLLRPRLLQSLNLRAHTTHHHPITNRSLMIGPKVPRAKILPGTRFENPLPRNSPPYMLDLALGGRRPRGLPNHMEANTNTMNHLIFLDSYPGLTAMFHLSG